MNHSLVQVQTQKQAGAQSAVHEVRGQMGKGKIYNQSGCPILWCQNMLITSVVVPVTGEGRTGTYPSVAVPVTGVRKEAKRFNQCGFTTHW